MSIVALLFSRSGRVARQPFAIAIVGVYVAGFLSHSLLGGTVVEKASVWPFALVQGALAWMWTVLHVKRLRDSGRPPGVAIGLACVYAAALLVVLVIMSLITASNSGGEPGSPKDLIPLLFVVYLVAFLFGGAQLNALTYLVVAFVVLLLMPVLLGFGYSLRVGTRPSQPAALTP